MNGKKACPQLSSKTRVYPIIKCRGKDNRLTDTIKFWVFPIRRSTLEQDLIFYYRTKTQNDNTGESDIDQPAFQFQVKRYLCDNPSAHSDCLRTSSYFFLNESGNRKWYLIYISNFHVTLDFYSGEQMLMRALQSWEILFKFMSEECQIETRQRNTKRQAKLPCLLEFA